MSGMFGGVKYSYTLLFLYFLLFKYLRDLRVSVVFLFFYPAMRVMRFGDWAATFSGR
jgi:hypothetical protein